MKTLINKSKNQYKYNCDRCGKEVSFKERTLHKITVQYGEREYKKLCDLCNKCYRSLQRGVFKK